MLKRFLLLTALALSASAAQAIDDIPTRYGPLVAKEGGLFFQGQPLPPLSEGYVMDAEKTFRLGPDDVVLVSVGGGGQSCPIRYSFVTVSPAGARATAPFGTCLDGPVTRQVGDTVEVRLPNFAGTSASTAAQRRAARTAQVYVFAHGTVTEIKPRRAGR